jgi:hypothetical protein
LKSGLLDLKADKTFTYSKATIDAKIDTKAPIHNPTFSGNVVGITKAMVQLGNVDNTSDSDKPISTAKVF